MRHPKAMVLSSLLLVLVQACASETEQSRAPQVTQPVQTPAADAGPLPPQTSGFIEPPFTIDQDMAGPGLAFATADFDGTGTVLVKVQVENLASVTGNEANLFVWTGNGDPPASSTTPPPGGTLLYATNGDVPLPRWTTHIDRTYDAAVDRYWVFVHVDHKLADGTRDHRYLRHTWVPSLAVIPDTPHELNAY